MLWRHRNAHIMYAFTLDCRPGAVQKRAQFRALRKVNEDIDYFVGSRRFRAVGVRSQGGKGPPVSRSCRRSARNDYLSLPRFWCRMILHRYLRSLGDCGRYLKVQPRTFGCFSVRITSLTCPHRPGSSPSDEMVENGAGRRIAQFGRFSWFCSEPSKMSDAPPGTILDHFVGWGRSRAVWTCRRCDSHDPVSKCTRFYLPISPTISQRSRSTSRVIDRGSQVISRDSDIQNVHFWMAGR